MSEVINLLIAGNKQDSKLQFTIIKLSTNEKWEKIQWLSPSNSYCNGHLPTFLLQHSPQNVDKFCLQDEFCVLAMTMVSDPVSCCQYMNRVILLSLQKSQTGGNAKTRLTNWSQQRQVAWGQSKSSIEVVPLGEDLTSMIQRYKGFCPSCRDTVLQFSGPDAAANGRTTATQNQEAIQQQLRKSLQLITWFEHYYGMCSTEFCLSYSSLDKYDNETLTVKHINTTINVNDKTATEPSHSGLVWLAFVATEPQQCKN